MCANNDSGALRAWIVFSGEPYDGCLLVYARNRNEARSTGFRKGPWEWSDYIDVDAHRRPRYDAYATGNQPYIIETNDELPDGAEPFYDDNLYA
jgi:hypothetical protein